MADTHDALRDDLMALLAASRELSADADGDLARIFLDRLRQPEHRDDSPSVSMRTASMVFVGAVWLVAAGILGYVPYYYYTHNSDVLGGYYSQTVPTVLVVAVLLTLAASIGNALQWRIPRISIDPPAFGEDR